MFIHVEVHVYTFHVGMVCGTVRCLRRTMLSSKAAPSALYTVLTHRRKHPSHLLSPNMRILCPCITPNLKNRQRPGVSLATEGIPFSIGSKTYTHVHVHVNNVKKKLHVYTYRDRYKEKCLLTHAFNTSAYRHFKHGFSCTV